MEEHDFVTSPLSLDFEKDGRVVKVEIYGSGKNDWILEVVDADDNSTVWDGTFETDHLAFEEFQNTVEEEGIEAVIGSVDLRGRAPETATQLAI